MRSMQTGKIKLCNSTTRDEPETLFYLYYGGHHFMFMYRAL